MSASSGKGLGQFEVKSGRIGVWDPCYGHGDTFPAENGTWFAEVEMSHEGNWGNRVAKLSAWKDGCYGKTPFKRGAVAGVDSGQMGIYDIRPDVNTDEDSYDEICNITLDKEQAGIFRDLGVVSSSGYGDGAYRVLINQNDKGEVNHISVVFIEDEDGMEDVEEDECLGCGRTGQELDNDNLCSSCAADDAEDDDEGKADTAH